MTDSPDALVAPVWDRYRRYLETAPEITVEWHDAPTGATGWLVLNSLRGGAAGGGTRMHAEVDREEVVYLAKAMELKFAFSGPPIGGGKSGIRFDAADPRRREVLARWFRAIRPFLERGYGTGGDVNVDEQRDLVPLFTELGLVHPQQGIVAGYLDADDERVRASIDALRAGLGRIVRGELGLFEAGLNVSDLITGYGVARAARRVFGGELSGRRVIVEGFGNVGASAVLHLARMGARIVGLVDADAGLAAPDGLGPDEVEALISDRVRGRIPPHPLRHEGADRVAAYAVDADLFIPAAISGSVDRTRLEGLRHAGVSTIVCGANQPFHEARLGATATQREADRHFRIVADVIGSMGMARAFHHLMMCGAHDRPEPIFEAVGDAVDEAVDRTLHRVDGAQHGLLAAAIDLALDARDAGEG